MRREQWVCALACLVLLFAAAVACFGSDLDLPVEPKPPTIPAPPKPPEPEPQADENPPTIYGNSITSETASVIFVLDDSGSMALDWQPDPEGKGPGTNRLDRAKLEVGRAVGSLPTHWKFTIYAYDCAYWAWSEGLRPASDENKAAALQWVRGLSPAGGTATHSGVCAALRVEENKLVVLVTDGEPSCAGDSLVQRAAIRASNRHGATVNVFGISCTFEAMRSFCRDVASDNNGTFTEVR